MPSPRLGNEHDDYFFVVFVTVAFVAVGFDAFASGGATSFRPPDGWNFGATLAALVALEGLLDAEAFAAAGLAAAGLAAAGLVAA